MPRPFPVLFALLLLVVVALIPLGGCSTQAEREAVFDKQLREMAGAPEAGLLKSMGRIPDNTYQLEDGSKILQWRWDTSYVTGGWAPMYRRVGWGLWMPMGGFPPTLVRQGCIVEWTVTRGNTQSYRWQGNGCSAVNIHSSPP